MCLITCAPSVSKSHLYFPSLLPLWSSLSELSEVQSPGLQSSYCPQYNLTRNSHIVLFFFFLSWQAFGQEAAFIQILHWDCSMGEAPIREQGWKNRKRPDSQMASYLYAGGGVWTDPQPWGSTEGYPAGWQHTYPYVQSGLPWWLSWRIICLQCGRPGFDPWVGEIPWRSEWLTTPIFWPGEFHGLYSPWSRKESDTTERLSLLPNKVFHARDTSKN